MPINHMKRCNLPDRVLIVADLHLDLWLASGRDPFAALDPDDLSQLDALIIVGDLSDKPKVRWPHALDHIAKYVDPRKTWIVPGNHDYYHHTLDGDERLASICYEKGVNFAQKRVIVVGETRYLCCTLWTNFALEGAAEFGMNDAAKRMNDYRYIRMAKSGYGRIRPLDTARVHSDHRAWLEAQLAEHYEGRTVVVTHHAPLPACLPDDYPVPSAYASDLSHIIERHSPQEWFYGHAHVPRLFNHGKTIVRSVSLGYPEQVPEDGMVKDRIFSIVILEVLA